MIKNKVTVLTVVPYEEPPRGEDELTDLLENATSLISAIKDLTKNVKDMIEQKTSHIEPPPARTYPPKPAGSSYNEYKPRRKPPCLIDYSKDVSVRYKSKDDTNVHAKGRVPAGSFGATNSLKQAFDRRKWILANPPEINKHVPQKKQQPVNKPKVPQTVIKEKAIQAEVPYESKYVQNTPEIANKPKKEAPKEVPVEPQNVTELVDVMVKNISGSSSDSLSSQVISPCDKYGTCKDPPAKQTFKLTTKLPGRRRTVASKDEKRSRGSSKERKDRKEVPASPKSKAAVRQSSEPALQRHLLTQ